MVDGYHLATLPVTNSPPTSLAELLTAASGAASFVASGGGCDGFTVDDGPELANRLAHDLGAGGDVTGALAAGDTGVAF